MPTFFQQAPSSIYFTLVSPSRLTCDASMAVTILSFPYSCRQAKLTTVTHLLYGLQPPHPPPPPPSPTPLLHTPQGTTPGLSGALSLEDSKGLCDGRWEGWCRGGPRRPSACVTCL